MDEAGLAMSLANYQSLNVIALASKENNTTNKSDWYLVFIGEKALQDGKSTAPQNLLLGIKFFLIGISLDDDKFWANLNPTEPNRIVDADIAQTDAGRIMLEADFQMKKDFAAYLNPCRSMVGQKYWTKMDAKHNELAEKLYSKYPGQIQNATNILFEAAIRNWIVPDEIYAFKNPNSLYILNYSLDINQEPSDKYSSFNLANQNNPPISTECLADLNTSAKDYGHFAAEMQKEMALPNIVSDVNNEEKYSDLRTVYVSLALAQWYKRNTPKKNELLDISTNYEELENTSWDPRAIWQDYVKSFTEGETKCWKIVNHIKDYNTTYNLTFNDTYNITHENTYTVLYNNTTYGRGFGSSTELNKSVRKEIHKDHYIDMGMPRYQSWQESAINSSVESRSYIMGGIDFGKIWPNIKYVENPTLDTNNIFTENTNRRYLISIPNSDDSFGQLEVLIVDDTLAEEKCLKILMDRPSMALKMARYS